MAAVAAVPAFAEDEFEFRLLRPIVSVQGFGEPNADFKDTDGQFKMSGVSVAANIPLGGVHIHSKGDVLGHQILLTAGFGTTSQTIDAPAVPLDLTPRLYNGVLAGSVVFASRKGNLYFGSLGASFAEESDTLSSPQARPYGVGLGSWRHSRQVMFVYGGAFTYVFGRGLLTPIFGVLWDVNPTWVISGALPFSWRFSQKLSSTMRMNYLLTAFGQRYRFNNDGTFPLEDSKVYEAYREGHLGAELQYRPSNDVTLLGEVGIAGARHLGFANAGETDFASSTIDAVPYVKLGARFAIGKSVIDQMGGPGQTPLGAGLQP